MTIAAGLLGLFGLFVGLILGFAIGWFAAMKSFVVQTAKTAIGHANNVHTLVKKVSNDRNSSKG